MPYNATNQLKIIASTPERLQEVKEFIKGEEYGVELPIDFNKIIPMPESLCIEFDATNTNDGIALLLHRQGDSSKLRERLEEFYWAKQEGITDLDTLVKRLIDFGDVDFEGARLAIKNFELYGYYYCDHWAIDKWGTKWNAYEQSEFEDTITFDTAWSTPIPVFEALSKQFPDVQFNVRFAVEDFKFGINVGEFTLLDGEVIYEDMPRGGSFEALLMFAEIKECDQYFIEECCGIDPDYTVDDLSDRKKKSIRLVYERQLFADELENFPKAVVDYLIEIAIEKKDYEIAAKLRNRKLLWNDFFILN